MRLLLLLCRGAAPDLWFYCCVLVLLLLLLLLQLCPGSAHAAATAVAAVVCQCCRPVLLQPGAALPDCWLAAHPAALLPWAAEGDTGIVMVGTLEPTLLKLEDIPSSNHRD